METNQTQIEQSIAKRKAIQYLTRVEEARRWINRILEKTPSTEDTTESSEVDELAEITENLDSLTTKEILEKKIPKKKSNISLFEKSLQKSELLVELINVFCSSLHLETYPVFKNNKKIFKHIENINFFKNGAYELGLPKYYNFDSSDCYNGKYIFDVVFFIHALSIFSTSKHGFLPMEKLSQNQIKFSEEDIQEKLNEADELPEFDSLYDEVAEMLKKTNATNLLFLGLKYILSKEVAKTEAIIMSRTAQCEICENHNKNCLECKCDVENKVNYKKTQGIVFLDNNLCESGPDNKNITRLFKCISCINAFKEEKNQPCTKCSHKEDCKKCVCNCICETLCSCGFNRDYASNNGLFLSNEEVEKLSSNTVTLIDIKPTPANTCIGCIKDNNKKCNKCSHMADCNNCICNCTCEGTCTCTYKVNYIASKGIQTLTNNESIKCENCYTQTIIDNSSFIKSGITSFLEKNSLEELVYLRNISIYSIKKFLNIFLENSELVNIDTVLQRKYFKIYELLGGVYAHEKSISDKQISLALLMANFSKSLQTIKTIPNIDNIVNITPVDSVEYRGFQNLFYLMQTEPVVFTLMLRTTVLHKNNESIDVVIESFTRNVILPVFNYVSNNREEYFMTRLLEFLLLLNESNETVTGDLMSENNYEELDSKYPLMGACSIVKNYFISCDAFDILRQKFLPVVDLLKTISLSSETDIGTQMNQLTEMTFRIMRENLKRIPNVISYFLNRVRNPKHLINEFLIPLFAGEFSNGYNVNENNNENYRNTQNVEGEEIKNINKLKTFIKYFKSQTDQILNYFDLLQSATATDGNDEDSINSNTHTLPSITLTVKDANKILQIFKVSTNIHKQNYTTLITDNNNLQIWEKLKTNTFKDNFKISMPYLLSLTEANQVLPLDEKQEIVFYLNVPYFIKKDGIKLDVLIKKLCVLIHIPGKSIEQILINRFWEEKEGNKKFEIIHALFFCNRFNEIYTSSEYSQEQSFTVNCTRICPLLKYKCPKVSTFKDELLNEFRGLIKEGSLSSNNEFNEFIPIIASYLLNIKMNRLNHQRELNSTTNSIKQLEQKYARVLNEESSIFKYYKQYCFNMMKKENIKNDYSDKITAFGTYRFKATTLMQRKILLKISEFDARSNTKPNEGVTVFLSCNVPNEFVIEVSVFDVICGRLVIGLDALLLNKYRGIKVVKLFELKGGECQESSMGELDNDLLIELINERYL
ncbi:Ras GTPase-activating-like protein rng2 [Cucumispora dikerogammari]|nr:Ras GTPase-activating-like protein rng2 [Cucumispora dikerogammari]